MTEHVLTRYLGVMLSKNRIGRFRNGYTPTQVMMHRLGFWEYEVLSLAATLVREMLHHL